MIRSRIQDPKQRRLQMKLKKPWNRTLQAMIKYKLYGINGTYLFYASFQMTYFLRKALQCFARLSILHFFQLCSYDVFPYRIHCLFLKNLTHSKSTGTVFNCRSLLNQKVTSFTTEEPIMSLFERKRIS